MPLVVVLHTNIYDQNKVKRLRGEKFNASREFCEAALKADPPLITVIDDKPAKKTGAKHETK